MKPLVGKVAVVTGASRGFGRGIAWRLGAAGATVYCTGRGRRVAPTAGYQASGPDSIEETATMVDRGGGVGIPVRVDHNVNSQVAGLFGRIRHEQGRLDVLVDVHGDRTSGTRWGRFWAHTRNEAHALWRAVLPRVVTCEHAVPLMAQRRSGLIIELTSRDARFDHATLFADLGRVAQIRLAAAVGKEWAPYGVTALAVTPGRFPTEGLDDHEENRDAGSGHWAKGDPLLLASETPSFIGRVIVALASDPRIHRKCGGLFSTWALGKAYGLTSEGGSGPSLEHHISEPCGAAPLDYHVVLPPAAPQRFHRTTPAAATDGGPPTNGLMLRTRG